MARLIAGIAEYRPKITAIGDHIVQRDTLEPHIMTVLLLGVIENGYI